MALNKVRPGSQMYQFITHTWNTIKGICPHNCSYCYMKKWGEQSPLHFDLSEKETDLGKNNFIFVGSGCDMFANDIPYKWILETLSHCRQFDNTYLFQSKNPFRFLNLLFPEKSIFCTTIETNRFYFNCMGKAPLPEDRANFMYRISDNSKIYITIEPIIDFDLPAFVDMIWMCKPQQVNIGADSGRNNLPEPSKDKILNLISELNQFTKVIQKDNLKRLL